MLAAPLGASAGSTTGTMNASVDVATSCRLFSDWLSFGTIKGWSGIVDATATLRLVCAPNIAYTVAIDNGLNFSGGTRRMSNGTPAQTFIAYQLYRDAARTLPWGPAAPNLVTGTTPADGLVSLTVYGRIPDSKVLARPYIDTVTITVNF